MLTCFSWIPRGAVSLILDDYSIPSSPYGLGHSLCYAPPAIFALTRQANPFSPGDNTTTEMFVIYPTPHSQVKRPNTNTQQPLSGSGATEERWTDSKATWVGELMERVIGRRCVHIQAFCLLLHLYCRCVASQLELGEQALQKGSFCHSISREPLGGRASRPFWQPGGHISRCRTPIPTAFGADFGPEPPNQSAAALSMYSESRDFCSSAAFATFQPAAVDRQISSAFSAQLLSITNNTKPMLVTISRGVRATCAVRAAGAV